VEKLVREINLNEEHPLLVHQIWAAAGDSKSIEIVFYFDEETNQYFLQIWN